MSFALLRQQLAEVIEATNPGTPDLATGIAALQRAAELGSALRSLGRATVPLRMRQRIPSTVSSQALNGDNDLAARQLRQTRPSPARVST
jgi:hypothetical protein